MILVGVLPKDKKVSLNTLALHFGKTLTGTKGGECRPDLDIPRYIRLCQAGKLNLNDFITDRTHLTEINEAIERMQRGEVIGRCLIGMEGL
jgi:Zn-dependent alcohol dehydrogenase